MRPARRSLRLPTRSAVLTACASITLCLGVACGGGGAQAPTPTVAAAAASASVPAPSPQRPALASPQASPSAVTAAVQQQTPTSTTTDAAAAGDTYEIQSGDTLLTVSEQFYGDATQWRKIYDANKDVIGSDPDKLKIGMKLKIPPKQ